MKKIFSIFLVSALTAVLWNGQYTFAEEESASDGTTTVVGGGTDDGGGSGGGSGDGAATTGKGISIKNIGGSENFPVELPTFNMTDEKDPITAVEKVILNYVITPIFFLAGGVAVIMVLYSAFRILISRAEEDGLTAAKNTLIWSFLGLGLIMVAYTIVRNLASIILQLF
ncbi:MAG: hypothetical protein Q8P95_01410 [bacterium]|nr:hypothetical protein [bacterium]